MLSRRGFIASLAAAFTLDPDKSLYVPGRVHYSVPSGKVFMPELRIVLFMNTANPGQPVFWQEVGEITDVRFKLGDNGDAPLSMVVPSGNTRSLSEVFDDMCGQSMSWGVSRVDPSTVIFRDRNRA